MKCYTTVITTFVFMIAMAISLSNNLYAQVSPFNDECSEAIQIPVAPETSFNEFSLEGAQRSTFAVASTCGNDEHAKDVWFTAIMPENGKLRVELSATKECPAITIYSGGCTNLGYLACDASKISDTEKTVTLIDADLAGREIFIRVHQEIGRTQGPFKIKSESIATQTVAVNSLDAKLTGKDITLDWQTDGESEVYYTSIQHSVDGINFQNIQSIEGRNNNGLEHYTFKHTQPQFGKNIYRLVLVMDSGEAIVFEQIEIYVERFNATVRVYPNPTTDGIYLAIPDWVKAADANLTLLDMSGKIILDRAISVNPKEDVYFDFLNHEIGNGNYLITLRQESELIMNSQLSIQH